MTALRLIIENHPSWQQTLRTDKHETSAESYAVPATSKAIYTLIGRRHQQWHTIVPRLDDLAMALDGLDSANRSELFDRLVIAQAHCLGEQPATRWDTYICAVPFALRAHDKPSFEAVLNRIERRNRGQPVAALLTETRPAKQGGIVVLALLFLAALLSQTPQLIYGAAGLWLFELLYRTSALDLFIPVTQARFIHKTRLFLYAMCLGLIILPMASALILHILPD
jgi:hypothetical protein